MATLRPKLHFHYLRDDLGMDEIRVHVHGAPHLRLITRPRYKTSGMSGDEWRTSVMWQERFRQDEWKDLDGPYGTIEGGCAAIFPGVCNSHPTWHDFSCDGVEILRKGHTLGFLNNGGKPQILLHALGHLPWIYAIFFEDLYKLPHMPRGHSPKAPWANLCLQPGCAAPAVSVYALKNRFDDNAQRYSALLAGTDQMVLQFCAEHLRRGDCGLEDADANYTVISGPGPDQHQTPDTALSPSRTVMVEMPAPEKDKTRGKP